MQTASSPDVVVVEEGDSRVLQEEVEAEASSRQDQEDEGKVTEEHRVGSCRYWSVGEECLERSKFLKEEEKHIAYWTGFVRHVYTFFFHFDLMQGCYRSKKGSLLVLIDVF